MVQRESPQLGAGVRGGSARGERRLLPAGGHFPARIELTKVRRTINPLVWTTD
jgi:hypothetical protein